MVSGYDGFDVWQQPLYPSEIQRYRDFGMRQGGEASDQYNERKLTTLLKSRTSAMRISSIIFSVCQIMIPFLSMINTGT